MTSPKVERALTQRIRAILEETTTEGDVFKVIGTRGLTYDVLFSDSHLSCTCPDFQMRAQMCKHIYYLVFHYYHITKDDILLWIEQYDLQLFREKRLSLVPEPSSSIADEARKDDCTICHDEIIADVPVTFCASGCRKPLHLDCFNLYMDYMKGHHKAVTCPSCRQVMSSSHNRMIM